MEVGSLFILVSSYLITLFGTNTKYIYEVFPLGLFGLGVGLVMQNTILITQQSAEKKCTNLSLLL